MSDISSWSTTAANNNSAAPNGFPEGMTPSGLNDSCREIMAALARFYAGVYTSTVETHNADYTLVLTDAGKTLVKTAADTSTRTWTIPLNSSVAFPTGTVIKLMNFDDNNLTITASDSAVLYWMDGTDAAVSDADRTLGRRGVAILQKTGTDEWVIEGNSGLF